MNKRVVFFGSGDYTIPILQVLKKHNLVCVVTSEKGGKVEAYAKQHNIPHLTTLFATQEEKQKIKELRPTLGILASYGAIIPQDVINMFPHSILNVHPSLLPKYKGPSPIQTTILNGDERTGVTIIKVDEKVDHGPIAYQVTVNLTGHETTEDLKRMLFKIGAELIDEIVKGIREGKSIKFDEQNHKNEIFTKKITKDDGKINLNDPPEAAVLKRMVRAYHPWPGVYFITTIGNSEKRVKLLPKNRIQVEGKNIMTLQDFINGYQEEGKRIIDKLSLQE